MLFPLLPQSGLQTTYRRLFARIKYCGVLNQQLYSSVQVFILFLLLQQAQQWYVKVKKR